MGNGQAVYMLLRDLTPEFGIRTRGDSPREREKMAVYRREHPELTEAQVGLMPKPGMGEP